MWYKSQRGDISNIERTLKTEGKMIKNPIENDMDNSEKWCKNVPSTYEKMFNLIHNKRNTKRKTNKNYTEIPFLLSDWQKLKSIVFFNGWW